MTRDVDTDDEFVEPAVGGVAGNTTYERQKAPYDLFMEAEGLPIYREIGVHDVRELQLGDWPRVGGRGAFLQLLGTENLWGMYVLEIPPGEALRPERHLYEELCYVVEGRGSVEVWTSKGATRSTFEWRRNSLFSIPLNCFHRLINASSESALLIVGTTAPPVMNLFQNNRFVFENDFRFEERYDEQADYFSFRDRFLAAPRTGRAMLDTSLIPDVVSLQLPLDNQRSTGYRRVQLNMAHSPFDAFIGEHASGKYAKAHYHVPSPVLICVKGEGYTLSWPRESGTHPWADGHESTVRRQDYVPGGMVAAAPGGTDFFHQHFGVSEGPLRFLVFLGLTRWGMFENSVKPGERAASVNLDIREGGCSIGYDNEDPFIRAEFERSRARNRITVER